MTSEIAILNRSAVALAADSALTVRKEKVWNNTNKLFSVSRNNDIGVMIFGHGDHCGVSWEIIIKRFRKHIGKKKYEYLKDCTEDFQVFLQKFIFPESSLCDLNAYSFFVRVIRECKKKSLTGSALKRRKNLKQYVDRQKNKAQDRFLIVDKITKKEFREKYSPAISELLADLLDIHVTQEMTRKVEELCFERWRRDFRSSFETGVVFAGYGEKEIFPAIEQLVVDGVILDQLRLWTERQHDLNLVKATTAYVLPFAQSDIAYLFMEGLQLDYLEFIEATVSGLLAKKSEQLIHAYVPGANRLVEEKKQDVENKALVSSFLDEFEKMRADSAIQPMLNIVASLPKEEMAAMAEALVEITSLRRKIDSSIESVGGPVDVAVISKADGFVWIKRKHYFSIDINRDFMKNRGDRYGGDDEI